MNATKVSVHTLLGVDVQYKVPLYQRRYVWNEANWSVLWKDILDQETFKFSGNARHFTGPIVTRLIKGQQKRFEVIDGQQRLMTFQIIFCVIRDLCNILGFCSAERAAKDHLENGVNAITDFRRRDPMHVLPDPTYKFIPTDYDKLAFRKVVNGQYGETIYSYTAFDEDQNCLIPERMQEVRLKVFKEKKVSRSILDAYEYFYERIRTYIQRDSEMISKLLQIVKSNFELVKITPGLSQRAEKIFESVNATGRKLSEFDYLRNDLFLRAGDESAAFYNDYWDFENDSDFYDWDNDTLESFFQAFLMAKLGPDSLNNDVKLFDVYQQELVVRARDLKEEFEELKDYAKTYKELSDSNSDFGARMQFYEDLSAYEEEESYNSYFASRYKHNITVIRSFIMYLRHGIEKPPDKNEILRILEILESYVVRRLLVDTVAGRYAYQAIKSFFRDLFQFENKSTFAVGNMVNYLVSTGKRRWISDPVVRSWFENNEYQKHQGWSAQALGFTERYILYRIENWKRDKAGKKLLSFIKKEFPPHRERVLNYNRLRDENAWASLGNLTFCWGGDVKPRNAEFNQETKFLKNYNNDTLILNREICEEENWGTNKIKKREQELLSIFYEIWKSEDYFLNNTISWMGLEMKYPTGSIVEGTVVNVGKFGATFQLKQGVEGVVRREEIAWTSRRNIDPTEYVNEGDRIKVKILEILEEKQILSLSIKQTQPDPWVEVPEKYKVGTIVRGIVYNILHYGAFVELEQGITGLIHISELAHRHIEQPEEIVSIGEELDLKVIQLDSESRRIELSLKAVKYDPWIKVHQKYKIGSVVRGKIRNIVDYGAFAELENGIIGLIHISELADRKISKPEEIISVGEELDLKVIQLDSESRRIGLSLRARTKKEIAIFLDSSREESIKTENTDESER